MENYKVKLTLRTIVESDEINLSKEKDYEFESNYRPGDTSSIRCACDDLCNQVEVIKECIRRTNETGFLGFRQRVIGFKLSYIRFNGTVITDIESASDAEDLTLAMDVSSSFCLL